MYFLYLYASYAGVKGGRERFSLISFFLCLCLSHSAGVQVGAHIVLLCVYTAVPRCRCGGVKQADTDVLLLPGGNY